MRAAPQLALFEDGSLPSAPPPAPTETHSLDRNGAWPNPIQQSNKRESSGVGCKRAGITLRDLDTDQGAVPVSFAAAIFAYWTTAMGRQHQFAGGGS